MTSPFAGDKMNDDAVHEDDRIYFRIPFTVYWIGRYGGLRALVLYRKYWDSKAQGYFWKVV